MKKSNKLYLTLALVTATVIGCQENEYNTFDSEYKAVNIWVGTQASVLDSTTFNYSYYLTKDSLMFYARLIGTLSSEPQTFTLEAYEGDLEEAEGSYEIGKYTFYADEYLKEFPIYFDPTKLKDTSAFKEQNGTIKFRLKQDGNFVAGADRYQTIHVTLKNDLAKPDTWDEAVYPVQPLYKYFGSYSLIKYKFMIQEIGKVDFKVAFNMAVDYDEATNTFSSPYAKFLTNKMTLALEEYNAAHPDAPLTDEWGYPITFK